MAENNSSAPLKNAPMIEAFEAAYSRDWNDPAGNEIKEIWHRAWQEAVAAQAAQAAEPLPLLVRDIARDIGITTLEACQALKGLGNFSVNSSVTADMARKLRESFPEATEDSSAGDQELSRISGGEKPKPWTGAEKSGLSKALAAVFGHEAKVQEFLGIDMHAEGRDPVEMLDRILAIYQRSMGKPAPDAEMAQVVATTKEMIFSWWAEHRELIREALVALQARPADALDAARYRYLRDGWTYHYQHESREKLDASLDAAMAAAQEGGKA